MTTEQIITDYKDFPDEYIQFKVGDRFTAMLLGYYGTYRVERIEIATVEFPGNDYHPYEIRREPVIITKGGLVWTTHVCGSLLEYSGRKSEYKTSNASKTWVSMNGPLKKNERSMYDYAIGEK